ncbi:MAG: BatD family protein [Phycisphaerales bacterium]|nr:BatD family protein [Phycisphaerales bacterium]
MQSQKILNMMLMIIAVLLAIPAMTFAEGTAQQHTPVTDGYVNASIPVYITIKNADDWEPPVMPEIEGLEINRNQGTQTSSSMHIVNGAITENKEVTYTFSITAREPGNYEIPAYPITVDGRVLMTFPVELTFKKAENKGLLSVEISGNPEKIYQGEATRLTMRILIKQFTDPRYNVSPDSREMWQLIDPESDWGPFTETMQELYSSRRALRGRPQTLGGEDDERDDYYLYVVQADTRPMSTGPLDISDIKIRMSYPISLRRDRGFFSSGLQVDQVRPVVASATGREILVEPLPDVGRPAEFNGAVGQFSIETTASPTTVSVGDPVTLTIKLTDIGTTPVDMDVVPAPELHEAKALDTDFRVPREALPGVVSGRSKTFTQTIRARDDSITSIPPVPYAYFDPESERYEVTYSRPILLEVNPADTITSSDISGVVNTSQGPTSDSLHNVAGGLLANYTGPDRLLADQGPPAIIWLLLLLLAPPLLALGITATRQGLRGHTANPDRIRSRRACRNAISRLDAANAASDAHQGALVAEAICTYVADRTGQPPAGFMRGDAVSTLQSCGVDETLTTQTEKLIATCEHLQYAGGGGSEISSVIESAKSLISKLDSLSSLKTNNQGAES